ncbi:MAG: hypothetical protein K0M45_00890 [Candidatus Paracaedibacteraceae bacterium]|nr:hypothetical protein [Candidatus Paracaedibacteraceae bacterium]
MRIRKYQFCLAFYMLLSPTFAFIIKGSILLEYDYNGEMCRRNPWEESVLRGSEEPYAQLTGRIVDNGKKPTTITLIAPNLAISCAHSAITYSADRRPISNWVFNNKAKTKTAFMIDKKIYESTIESFHIHPLYNPLSSNGVSKASDISIIKLAEEIPVNNFLPFYTLSEPSISPGIQDKVVCVSANQIHNQTEKADSPYYRHITTPQIRYNADTFNFREEFFVPAYYKSFSVQRDSSGWIPLPPFKPNNPAPSGLQGPLTPGDSGSPLMISYEDRYHLMGIATHVQRQPAYNYKTNKYTAGQSFYNNWAPLSNNLNWIKGILEQENALSYHPELLTVGSKNLLSLSIS